MSRPATGEPGRGVTAPAGTTRTLEATGAILIVLALGLAFRLILAHQLPGSGFAQDLAAFRFWASNLATEGPFGFYERDFFHDYTPGYMYVLWLVGIVGGWLGGIGDLIKVPAILADVALAWLVASMVRELGGSQRASLIGAALVIVNPITWFDSVVWGQVDSVGLIFLLLAIRELWRDRPERSAVLTVVAAIVKPQLGILVPIVAAVTIRRALWPTGGYGAEEAPPRRSTTLDWERRTRGPLRIVTTGLAGLLTAVVVSAPFGLSIVGLLEQVGTAAAGYPYLSVNAYNPWALLSLDGNGIAANGLWVCDVLVPPGPETSGCAAPLMFGPIPALAVGTTLLVLAIVAVVLAVARRPDRLTILLGAVILAFAFFVLPTRVHERYLFPLVALGAILAAVSLRWRIAYVLVSAATFANMYVVLTTLYPDNPNVSDWLGLGPTIRSGGGVAVVALTHAIAFGWACLQLRDGALERLRGEIAAGAAAIADRVDPADGTDEPPAEPLPAPGRPAEPIGAGPAPELAPQPAAMASAGPVDASTAPPDGRPYPVWRPTPALAELGLWRWFRERVGERPIRPDRTATLHGEGGGRLDRLDVWLVAVLVLAVFGARLWRLAEPYQMHFDEVYHARTATEFLQHWRYGISHDIYEWTHPHLAKYAMAGGLVAWGDDRVSATSELGVSVVDAAIEPRFDDTLHPGRRSGDRLHVATGEELRAYDLATRALVSRTPLRGASAVAVDTTGHRLIAGTDGGRILVADLSALDEARAAGVDELALGTFELAALDGPIERLHVTGDGSGLVAQVGSDRVVMLDAGRGTVTGEVALAGIAQLADAGRGPALVADPAAVTDAPAAAARIVELIGGSPEAYLARLTGEGDRSVIAAIPDAKRSTIDDAIAAGELPGIEVADAARVAVAEESGLTFLLPAAGEIATTMPLEGGASGAALVTGIDDAKLYVTTNPSEGPRYVVVVVGGDEATKKPTLQRSWELPGGGSWVAYDAATEHVHILGAAPAGAEGSTVYVVEPHANAVYADARLPFAPVAWAMDANELYPAADREQLLALDADGTTTSVEVGSHAFAWRLPGVIAGTLMAVLVFLLARMFFARRSVALIAGLLTLADGMLFVQARIGMNDAYVALFIMAAYTLFAGLWLGRWRWRGAFWVLMPAIGLLLGLALASKWVAAYAIGALGILILARSALGRLVLVAGMIVVTTVLGYMAISVPEGQSGGNLTFALIMIALALVAVVVTVLHPIAWSRDELRFAVGAPVVGAVALSGVAALTGRLDATIALGSVSLTVPLVAGALAAGSVVVLALFWLAGRWGFGPLAAPPAPDDPAAILDPPAAPASGWLRPGWRLGLPVAWMFACLLATPVAVYVASYVPWAFVDNHQLVEGWPAGHTGQTLVALTGEMYRYHNTLSSGHAASSPWWAWPFDLKPVWFYQGSFAGGTGAAIYDAGNLAIWWLGVPALAFAAWQAFRRRSLPLALITIGFACQWVAWARIDRAAFQYHYYTSLPFVVLALAYFIAELWHGPSRRTWLVAKLAAAAAIVAPVAMWLFHRPLCGFVNVEAANPGSRACPTLIPEFVLTARSAALAIVLGLAVLILLRYLLTLARPNGRGAASDEVPGDGGEAVGRGGQGRSGPLGALGPLGPMIVSSALAVVAIIAVGVLLGEAPILVLQNVAVEPVAILVALPLLLIAGFVATARDARRFVVGMLVAIVAVFVAFYPNIAALPLPSPIVNMYQGLLPTYVYPFQFPVSTVDRTVAGPSLLGPGPALLLVALTVASLVLAYSAWVWRIALAERRQAEVEDRTPSAAGGPFASSGGEA